MPLILPPPSGRSHERHKRGSTRGGSATSDGGTGGRDALVRQEATRQPAGQEAQEGPLTMKAAAAAAT